jgi:four helix bundle protein
MPKLRHHSLVAWQRADDLFIRVHMLAHESFPATERFELSAQLRRAAYSVAANIAEGYARRYRRARLHFLNIAEGSLAEVGYCIHASHRLGYIADNTFAELQRDLDRVGAPLAGLVRATREMPFIVPTLVIGSLMLAASQYANIM